MGLVKLCKVAIDGTKIKANTNRHKTMSCERRQPTEADLKAQASALLERANRTDAAEVNEPELEFPAEIERRSGTRSSSRARQVTAAPTPGQQTG